MTNGWSIALCPSGKIIEIKEGFVPPETMLPPCSNNDLPTWVHVSRHDKADRKLDEIAESLRKMAESKGPNYPINNCRGGK